MAFVNIWMLFVGGGLVTLPIVLHLMMRQKPKHFVFPALRFLQETQLRNDRRLKLKHLLLLILRGLLLALLGLTFAKPSAASHLYSQWVNFGIVASAAGIAILLALIVWFLSRPNLVLLAIFLTLGLILSGISTYMLVANLQGNEQLALGQQKSPVAAVMIFDTSPRMDLKFENKTRLVEAQEISTELIAQLPLDSKASIYSTDSTTPFFAIDIAAAKKQITTLVPKYVTSTIPEAVDKSIELLKKETLDQREIYIFTDMTSPAWEAQESLSNFADRLKEHRIRVYLIDVGNGTAENTALGDLQLAKETVGRNGTLELQIPVKRKGGKTAIPVELGIEQPDPSRPVRRDNKTLVPDQFITRSSLTEIDENGQTVVRFSYPDLPPGTHHGYVRIAGEDGLAFDNTRFFTIESRNAIRLLVIRPDNVNEVTFTEAIAPEAEREAGKSLVDQVVVSQSEISTQALEEFDAIVLLDPSPLEPATWDRLHAYVEKGKGLAVFLGRNALKKGEAGAIITNEVDESFNSENARKLLAGEIGDVWRSTGDQLLLQLNDLAHPIAAPFRTRANSIPWHQFPIYRHWGLRSAEEIDPATIRVVAQFSNGNPAIIERKVERGLAITATTPITDTASESRNTRWNDLTTGECWPYFLLINQVVDYMISSKPNRLNYSVGEYASLTNDLERDPTSYFLFSPRDEEPQKVTAKADRCDFKFTDSPGHYRLRGNKEGNVLRGFSVNIPANSSNLTRIDSSLLNQFFGDGNFQLATNETEIEREQGRVRLGDQFFPILMFGVLFFFAIEYLFANRFYELAIPQSLSSNSAKGKA